MRMTSNAASNQIVGGTALGDPITLPLPQFGLIANFDEVKPKRLSAINSNRLGQFRKRTDSSRKRASMAQRSATNAPRCAYVFLSIDGIHNRIDRRAGFQIGQSCGLIQRCVFSVCKW